MKEWNEVPIKQSIWDVPIGWSCEVPFKQSIWDVSIGRSCVTMQPTKEHKDNVNTHYQKAHILRIWSINSNVSTFKMN